MQTMPTAHEMAAIQAELEKLDHERDALIDELRAAPDERRRRFLRRQVAQVGEERFHLAQVRGLATLLSMPRS